MKNEVKKQQPKPKPLSPTQRITLQVAREHKGLSDHEVGCRLTNLNGVIRDTEETIAELRGKLAKLSIRLLADRATAAGLEQVLKGHDDIA